MRIYTHIREKRLETHWKQVSVTQAWDVLNDPSTEQKAGVRELPCHKVIITCSHVPEKPTIRLKTDQ